MPQPVPRLNFRPGGIRAVTAAPLWAFPHMCPPTHAPPYTGPRPLAGVATVSLLANGAAQRWERFHPPAAGAEAVCSWRGLSGVCVVPPPRWLRVFLVMHEACASPTRSD
ncbi:hypothetical protein NDU88_002693 [Pleurodeles waltl]|uniref:Uncharacterized protein n=1 Tax=Pleurodeles waltl TaxID=8319 RepID=A0AAV7NEH2_PLEWA|nr:hypothetical protein NDU88_002693 [Pleurodeles waltl]